MRQTASRAQTIDMNGGVAAWARPPLTLGHTGSGRSPGATRSVTARTRADDASAAASPALPCRRTLARRLFSSAESLLIHLMCGIWHVLCDRSANVALTFALMCVPITLTVGGAIDYSRAVHFRAEVQGVVDSAALAGATAFVNAASQSLAVSVVTEFMNAGIAKLPTNNGVSFSAPTMTIINVASTPAAYQVAVTATANVGTTFLGILIPSIPVTVSATAENPVVSAAANFSGFSSSAWDKNTIYWYPIPPGSSNTYVPPNSALVAIWSDAGGVTAAPASVAASQKIGFALVNITGGLVANYGANQYGGAYLSTHTFYSSLPNPSSSVNGYNSTNNPGNVNGVNGNTGNNCSLQTAVVPASGVIVAPPGGSCYPPNTYQYMSPTCSQLGGQTIHYYWNDMGGNPDDKDYNDAEFSFSCGANASGLGANGPQNVVLIQ
jgi:Flp pilus assembly protein TadG